jgi:hypothetical protein
LCEIHRIAETRGSNKGHVSLLTGCGPLLDPGGLLLDEVHQLLLNPALGFHSEIAVLRLGGNWNRRGSWD